MKSPKTRWLLMVAALAVSALAVTAWAAEDDEDRGPRGRRMRGGPFAELGRDLDLTEQQRERIHEIMSRARQEVYDEVLTDAQRETVDRFREERLDDLKTHIEKRFDRMAEKLDLSEEQVDDARKILDEAIADAADADGPHPCHQILDSARERIREEVLTDEQREKADRWRESRDRSGDEPRGNRSQRHGKRGGHRYDDDDDERDDEQ